MSLVINTKESNTYELQNELVQDNRDIDSKGGGILAYINTDFPVSRKTKLESEILENISVEVHINKNKWLVMGIYKPPSMSDNDCSTLFIKNIDQCIINYDNIIVMCELNFDMLNDKKYQDLKDF
jgi:hypothetical protein